MEVNFKILKWYEEAQSTYWFYPLCFSLITISILSILLALDASVTNYYPFNEYLIFKLDPHRARNLLPNIVTSSVTITSVTFSITILILSLASQQLGPQLLPNFIKQGKTQIVLSVFISCYLYNLLLTILSSNQFFLEKTIFFSLYCGVLFAIVSIFFLIYFIHYVSKSIQIEFVLAGLYEDTQKILIQQLSNAEDNRNKGVIHFETLESGFSILTDTHGYIQSINLEKLFQLANQYEVIIQVLAKTGDYVLSSSEIAVIYSDKKPDQSLKSAVKNTIPLGDRRTLVHDVTYGFEQIIEIALRALSPGINNPFSAIQCIHILGQLLNVVSQCSIPTGYMSDETNKPVIIYKSYSYADFVNLSINPIRQNATPHVSVIRELLKLIHALLRKNIPQPMRAALKEQVEVIVAQAYEMPQFDLGEDS
ncbi:MAG: DUF2254 domain-containing protein [Legionellaceae bacterium]|nr:DUF2254 domain-containing protein [Legionellaceae bacterium]